MLFVVCSLSPVVCGSWFVARCVLSVVCCLLCVVVLCSLRVVCRFFVVCGSLPVVYYMLFVVLVYSVCCMLSDCFLYLLVLSAVC